MSTVSDDRIQPALHALLSNDAEALHSSLDDDPELANAAWKGNTLLEWATQPPNGINGDCIAVLIESGASLDRALGLAACFNLAELCTQLLDAGADPTSFESDASPITPLESAAMHGSTAAADVLVKHGLHRPALWLASATGQLGLVTEWVAENETLNKPAGHYRPIWTHVGRPEAPPPRDDPAQILGEALTCAAANGRTEIVDYLLDCGVPIDAAPYQGITSLHFAVQLAKPKMVEHLLDRGASTNLVDDHWHATPAKWAEVCADGSAKRSAIVALLA